MRRPAEANSSNILKAARLLKRGGLVAFPTETVYGLGADAFNRKAVCRIFEVKKRPSFDPLIVHVATMRDAVLLWQEVPALAKILMQKFWPGPLSLVLSKNARVPDVVTSGLSTVAVRMPAHPVALELIRRAGCPVAAPSANLFGYTSPTTALAVAEDLGNKIGMILEGGSSRVGVESTVIKIEGNRLYLLRPGGITVEEIQKATGKKVTRIARSRKHEAPGQLKSHYAPKAPMILAGEDSGLFFKKMSALKTEWEKSGRTWPKISAIRFSDKSPKGLFSSCEVLSPQKDLYRAASRLFQAVRKLDKMNPRAIVAFPFPENGIGLAIRDRLEKASGGKSGWQQFLRIINQK